MKPLTPPSSSTTSPATAAAVCVLLLAAGGSGVAAAASRGSCTHGSSFGDVATFWEPNADPARADTPIDHRATPYVTPQHGYKIQAGNLGLNRWANSIIHSDIDKLGAPYSDGQVDRTTGLPVSRTGGWGTARDQLHEYWDAGFLPESFNVLMQKGSLPDNIELIESQPVPGINAAGEEETLTQNVLRLHAKRNTSTGPGATASGAIVQTAGLFASGFFEIKARLPQSQGLVFAMWTFHYETHRAEGDPVLKGGKDNQYINVTGAVLNELNHEIDIEIPGSCPAMCTPTGGCGGQFGTANLNTYQYSDNQGTGPAYASLCVNASTGAHGDRLFVDGEWHTYGFEWHTGDVATSATSDKEREGAASSGGGACAPRVDFFFDGEYVATNDVFVPTRASRFVFGLYPSANVFWAGAPDYSDAHMDVAEVHVCPFGEARDAAYPQLLDEPSNHPHWTNLTLRPKQQRIKGGRTHRDVCSFTPVAPAPKEPPAPAPAPSKPPAPAACSLPRERPNNCPCSKATQCKSGDCDVSGTCQEPVKPPAPAPSKPPAPAPAPSKPPAPGIHPSPHPAPAPPTGCSKPEGRPDGCACDHSFECTSQWCDGKCEPKPPTPSQASRK